MSKLLTTNKINMDIIKNYHCIELINKSFKNALQYISS